MFIVLWFIANAIKMRCWLKALFPLGYGVFLACTHTKYGCVLLMRSIRLCYAVAQQHVSIREVACFSLVCSRMLNPNRSL